MKYAEIKPNYDQTSVFKGNRYIFSLISYELYTMREVKKYSIPDRCFNIVDFPKNKSYFFFGCRFNELQDSYRFNK